MTFYKYNGNGENVMYFNNIEKLKDYVKEIEMKPSEQLMIFAADRSASEIDEVIEYLNEKEVKFFGGIYAGLLVGEKHLREGYIVNKLEVEYSALVLPYLMRYKTELNPSEDYTAIVLVDGVSSQMKALTDTIYSKMGDTVKYAGGGAGFYDLSHRPCIFDNKGKYEDVAYVCIVKSKLNLAVKHGWKKLRGPFIVEESRDNILSKLDNYDAFDVYREVIEEERRITLYKEDFFTYAKEHPFGIVQKGKIDLVVRDPIALNEDYEIVCVADIPENSEVYILQGDINSLLSSSLQIAENCAADAPDKYKPFLFDCISRAMFMEERFEEELYNIQSKLKNVVEGTLSIGEISSGTNGGIQIHNKSTVIGILTE
jgi:hypothetical protein